MTPNISTDDVIYIAGHRGMVGAAIIRQLEKLGFENILTRTHSELDLKDTVAVREFFNTEKIDRVVLAAAKVGGIHANNIYPAEFIYDNLMIQSNVINEVHRSGVKDLLFLGSSCIYPKFAPQPMKEEHLLTGILEPTNEPYAIAKIAGIKMCEAYNRQYGTRYRSVMPANLFGPGDNYHLENSHVLPAMIRKYHLAKLAMNGDLAGILDDEKIYGPIPTDISKAIGYSQKNGSLDKSCTSKVVLWGTGESKREFLHVDDMAVASLFVMGMDQNEFETKVPGTFLNVGSGRDISIREVALLIKDIVGYEGETIYDSDQPDGTPRKLLDTTMINNLGWQPCFGLVEGIRDTYDCYLNGNKAQ